MNRREFLQRSAGAATAAALGARTSSTLTAAPRRPGRPPLAGPLRVHPDNRRYFTDSSGRAVYLTGLHTWASLVDMSPTDPPAAFDYSAYLDRLDRYGHNFIRLWTWELTRWDTGPRLGSRVHTVAPQAFARTGPGKALDGKPKFDLEKFDPEYFKRLRSRVEAAAGRGIFVSIMLFEGWGLQFVRDAFQSHPFHPANNISGVRGARDGDGDGRGLEIHTLADPAVTRIQEAYVRKVIDTVNDLDNVLYEISNENHPASTKWQYGMIDFIHRLEKGKARQHPVGMTFQYKGGSNRVLFDSPADWISPNPEGGYRDDPPAADGSKVIVTDTDHLWGIGGNGPWVWKSMLRGMNPIFMDPYDGVVLGRRFDPKFEPIRTGMGHALRVAERIDLARMTPRGAWASSGYCLASDGEGPATYLVYLPKGGDADVDLSAAQGKISVEWIDPDDGRSTSGGTVAGGARRKFIAPFAGLAVLLLETA